MSSERWSIEILERYGLNTIVIYDEDSSVGSINVEDDDIELWKTVIRIMNLSQHDRKKIVERMDMQGL